jgi:predicted DNA-binding transcriptional regulator AlpA
VAAPNDLHDTDTTPALVALSPESIDALADALASRFESPEAPPRRLLDARQVAQLLGVSREWVYDHQDELGVQRLATDETTQRPRLRFDAERVESWLTRGDRRPAELKPATPRARRRTSSSGAPLLPFEGRR